MRAVAIIPLCVCLLSSALAKPPLLVNYQDGDGQYHFGYSDPLSMRTESHTVDGVTRGTYSYYDQNGAIQTTEYEAGKDIGFRVKATNLPEAPLPVDDTPEVKNAREKHLQLLEEANRREEEEKRRLSQVNEAKTVSESSVEAKIAPIPQDKTFPEPKTISGASLKENTVNISEPTTQAIPALPLQQQSQEQTANVRAQPLSPEPTASAPQTPQEIVQKQQEISSKSLPNQGPLLEPNVLPEQRAFAAENPFLIPFLGQGFSFESALPQQRGLSTQQGQEKITAENINAQLPTAPIQSRTSEQPALPKPTTLPGQHAFPGIQGQNIFSDRTFSNQKASPSGITTQQFTFPFPGIVEQPTAPKQSPLSEQRAFPSQKELFEQQRSSIQGVLQQQQQLEFLTPNGFSGQQGFPTQDALLQQRTAQAQTALPIRQGLPTSSTRPAQSDQSEGIRQPAIPEQRTVLAQGGFPNSQVFPSASGFFGQGFLEQNPLLRQQGFLAQQGFSEQQTIPRQNGISEQQGIPRQSTEAEQQGIQRHNIISEQEAKQSVGPQQQATPQQVIPRNNIAEQQQGAIRQQGAITEQQFIQQQNSILEQQAIARQNIAPGQQGAIPQQGAISGQQFVQQQSSILDQQAIPRQNAASEQQQGVIPQLGAITEQQFIQQQNSILEQQAIARQNVAPGQQGAIPQQGAISGQQFFQQQSSILEQQARQNAASEQQLIPQQSPILGQQFIQQQSALQPSAISEQQFIQQQRSFLEQQGIRRQNAALQQLFHQPSAISEQFIQPQRSFLEQQSIPRHNLAPEQELFPQQHAVHGQHLISQQDSISGQQIIPRNNVAPEQKETTQQNTISGQQAFSQQSLIPDQQAIARQIGFPDQQSVFKQQSAISEQQRFAQTPSVFDQQVISRFNAISGQQDGIQIQEGIARQGINEQQSIQAQAAVPDQRSFPERLDQTHLQAEPSNLAAVRVPEPMRITPVLSHESVKYTPEVMAAREAHFRAYATAARLAEESDRNPQILMQLLKEQAANVAQGAQSENQPQNEAASRSAVSSTTAPIVENLNTKSAEAAPGTLPEALPEAPKVPEQRIQSLRAGPAQAGEARNIGSAEKLQPFTLPNGIEQPKVRTGLTPASTSLRVMDTRLPSLNEFQQSKLKEALPLIYDTSLKVTEDKETRAKSDRHTLIIKPVEIAPIATQKYSSMQQPVPKNWAFQYVYL